MRKIKKYPYHGSQAAPEAHDLILESNTCVLSLPAVLSSGVFPAKNAT